MIKWVGEKGGLEVFYGVKEKRKIKKGEKEYIEERFKRGKYIVWTYKMYISKKGGCLKRGLASLLGCLNISLFAR